MNLEARIKKLAEFHLADPRAPDVTGFVDQLFCLAAEKGEVGCVLEGDSGLRFFANAEKRELVCVVEHAAARAVLRMMCARLGAICREQTTSDLLPYADKAEIELDVNGRRRWRIAFTNTTRQQEFRIEAVACLDAEHGSVPTQ